MNHLLLAEDFHEISSFIWFLKVVKIFENIVCCKFLMTFEGLMYNIYRLIQNLVFLKAVHKTSVLVLWHGQLLKTTKFQIMYWYMTRKWEHSGRLLDSRLRGCRFKPHLRHCVVVLEEDTFILA